MRILVLQILVLLVTHLAVAAPVVPMNLDWNHTHETYEPPPGFRYYMGDIKWGQLVFVGENDLFDSEVELQINFANKRIISATLILGPRGNQSTDCFIKYKNIVKLLNKKYGHFKYKFVEKDPIIDEMIYVSECYPLSVGMVSLENRWLIEGYIIKSLLFGEDRTYYIEIEYTPRSRMNLKKNLDIKKVLQKL